MIELSRGPRAFQGVEDDWRSLEANAETLPFQTYAWARAWIDAICPSGEPWVLRFSGETSGIMALVLKRAWGIRSLQLLGEGLSDYLGPTSASVEVAAEVGAFLSAQRAHYDVLDLRSLRLGDDAHSALARSLPGSHVRLYERCPAIDTRGDWDAYLKTRRKKFRANIKRAARRVESYGTVSLDCGKTTPALLQEMLEVERQSWKWKHGTAFLQSLDRRRFLEAVLLHDPVNHEVWICRIDGDLAGFAVVLRTASRRLYYLPSFRAELPDVGSYLLAEVVRQTFSSGVDEFDLLQGDEGYKLAWATHEHEVREIASPGAWPLGLCATLAVRARWYMAKSESLHSVRGALARIRRGA